MDAGIKKYPTIDYVGFSYNGRMVANLYKHRKSFDFNAVKLDEDLHWLEDVSMRIESGDEDCTIQLDLIKNSIKKLDGRKK